MLQVVILGTYYEIQSEMFLCFQKHVYEIQIGSIERGEDVAKSKRSNDHVIRSQQCSFEDWNGSERRSPKIHFSSHRLWLNSSTHLGKSLPGFSLFITEGSQTEQPFANNPISPLSFLLKCTKVRKKEKLGDLGNSEPPLRLSPSLPPFLIPPKKVCAAEVEKKERRLTQARLSALGDKQSFDLECKKFKSRDSYISLLGTRFHL